MLKTKASNRTSNWEIGEGIGLKNGNHKQAVWSISCLHIVLTYTYPIL